MKKEDLKAGYPDVLSSLHPHGVGQRYCDTKETQGLAFFFLVSFFKELFHLFGYRELAVHFASFK